MKCMLLLFLLNVNDYFKIRLTNDIYLESTILQHKKIKVRTFDILNPLIIYEGSLMGMNIEEQYDKIFRYCYFKVYDKQLAEDITQETFYRFLKQNYRIDKSKELPCLYTIARNLCTDVFRCRVAESLNQNQEEPTYDPFEKWTDDFTFHSIIARLPKDEQELLLLRYANELSVADICKITGLSRFAVYRRISNILKQLKDSLKKEGFYE